MRILPHHQDTGGFFVAVLEKVNHLPWERASHIKEESTENSNSCQESNKIKRELSLEEEEAKNVHTTKTFDEMNRLRIAKQKRRRIASGFKEDPFVYFKEDEDVWLSIK